MPLAAGLGGDASPQNSKTGWISAIQPGAWGPVRSILAGHHDGDGGFWLVHIEGATSGNQFNQARGAVVVADIERKGQAGLAGCCLADGMT